MEYLTVNQAAKIAGVEPVTIRKWCGAGKIDGAIKTAPGRRGDWQIPRDEIQKLAGQKISKGGRRPSLTTEQKVKIKQRLAAGDKPNALADEYGVSYRTIYRIGKQ